VVFVLFAVNVNIPFNNKIKERKYFIWHIYATTNFLSDFLRNSRRYKQQIIQKYA